MGLRPWHSLPTLKAGPENVAEWRMEVGRDNAMDDMWKSKSEF
jgi:hypothetical protein